MRLKVGVWRPGAIGDVIMTIPCIRAIKKNFPDCEVDLLADNENKMLTFKNLIETSPLIDNIKSINKSHPDATIVSRYDKFFMPQYGHLKPDLHDKVGRIFGEQLKRQLNIEVDNYRPEIILTEEDEKLGAGYKDCVVIHNTAMWTTLKNPPMHIINWIIGVVHELGLSTVQIGGYHKTQSSSGAEWDRHIKSVEHDFRGKLTLRESAAILKHSRFLVGIDSWPMHAMYAFGKISMILYGSSDPMSSGYDENISLYADIECQPCHAVKQCKAPICFDELSYVEIMSGLYKIIELTK